MEEKDTEGMDNIDELSKKLYNINPDSVPRKRQGVLHRIDPIISRGWDNATNAVNRATDEIQKKKNTPFFKKFFIGSLIFFVLAISFGLIRFFGGGNTVSSNNISIDVFGNAFAEGGEELPLDVSITNKNSVPLEYTDLIIEYPKGASVDSEIERKRITIGTIGPSLSVTERIPLVLYGEQGSIKNLSFRLEYRVPNSNSIFRKTREFSVTINSSPIILGVEGPSSVSPNQDVKFTIVLTPNATSDISWVLVKVDYPTGFKFKQSNPETTSLSNVWSFDSLPLGAETRIEIEGTIYGEDGDERVFKTHVGAPSGSNKNTIGVIYNSNLTKIAITRPFLESKLTINGYDDEDIISTPRSDQRAEISWANNLPVKIVNAEITAKITGAVLDKSSIVPQNGFYNSGENTIIWNRDTMPVFSSLDPGESGTVAFNFASLSLVRADRSTFENPEIIIEVSIKGRQPTEGDVIDEVKGFERKIVKFNTDFAVSGETLRNSGPFVNTGPVPPKAGIATTYTISWTLTNSASNVTGAEVRATLPTYVHFLNQVSPSSENVSLDPVSGEIVWKAGVVPKGAGLGVNTKKVYFTVELVPSLSQVGNTPSILGKTTATGVDSFTKAPVSSVWSGLSTEYFNDPSYISGNGKISN